AKEGAAPLAERTLVLAVGSNQTPETIARKYRRSGRDISVTTPFVRCTVHHLAVGHVAHIAVPGYLPAAPYRAEGGRMELVATWFDEEQVAVVDETEPNYDRLRLCAGDFPLTLPTGPAPATRDVYAPGCAARADPTGAARRTGRPGRSAPDARRRRGRRRRRRRRARGAARAGHGARPRGARRTAALNGGEPNRVRSPRPGQRCDLRNTRPFE